MIGYENTKCGEIRMRLFVGTHINKVDSKGRVSVPAAFRAVVSDKSFNGIVVYPHLEQACLEGGGIDRLTAITDALEDNFGIFSAEQEAFASAILANAHQLQFDDNGRVMLPKEVSQSLKISGQVAFVGLGKRFQIWDPAVWQAAQTEHKALARTNRSALVGRNGATKITGGVR